MIKSDEHRRVSRLCAHQNRCIETNRSGARDAPSPPARHISRVALQQVSGHADTFTSSFFSAFFLLLFELFIPSLAHEYLIILLDHIIKMNINHSFISHKKRENRFLRSAKLRKELSHCNNTEAKFTPKTGSAVNAGACRGRRTTRCQKTMREQQRSDSGRPTSVSTRNTAHCVCPQDSLRPRATHGSAPDLAIN